MLNVRWEDEASDELAVHWFAAGSAVRHLITEASHRIDQVLQSNPLEFSESRPDGRRILFMSPLGVLFRLEDDGHTVSVLKLWMYRLRGGK